MRFVIPKIDLRRQMSGSDTITEETTGKTVGQFLYNHGDRSRQVLLYGKYSGDFETHEECVAFAKGVAAVLSHMTKVERRE